MVHELPSWLVLFLPTLEYLGVMNGILFSQNFVY